MTVEAEKAIQFTCEKCGHFQYESYTLRYGWHEGRSVMEDRIDCEKCGHENHLIEEI
jgi:predicted nucleic-acid-binding Zn-ribbon protein